MSNYTFSTLNDKEFEQIAKDLLNAKLNLDLQAFKGGVDKGIDLRCSTPLKNNSIVVQAKHYVGSKFAQLKHTLKSSELIKVKKLNPDRYLIVTSLSLSAKEKDEIRKIFMPYIISSNDIFGQDDLNSILEQHSEIEKRHFKLWFSSLTVFNAVLNNAIEGRTKYLLKSIEEKVALYVITKKLDDAIRLLQKEKLLLITGQPGIGKTTLAEVILVDRAKHDYKIYKVENLLEAEEIISPNDDEKQLFYFDDFLGPNYLSIVSANKTESQITGFIERIKNTPNKYLVLTTRTIILNHAIEKYEKINQSKLSFNKFELKLSDYTKYEKALILYNHLYFKKIKQELYESILTDKFYASIIQHKNYTPRIIEFITDKQRIDTLTPIKYNQFILNNLNNPTEIWCYSFINQINFLERCLVITLFSLGNYSMEIDLIKAYEGRLEYEIKAHNQIVDSNQFNESIRILLNGFLVSNLADIELKIRYYTFINPSLVDFLIGYITDSFQERKSIINSIIYFEQLDRFDPERRLIPLEKDLQLILRTKISNAEIEILTLSNTVFFNDNYKNSVFLETLCKYCKDINIDTFLLQYFEKIDFTNIDSRTFGKLEYVLLNLGDVPQTITFVKTNFSKIIESLMLNIYEADSAFSIPFLFEKYEQDYESYCKSSEGLDNILGVIENVLRLKEENIINANSESINEFQEAEALYESIKELEDELIGQILPDIIFVCDFGVEIDNNYWEQQIENNLEQLRKEEAQQEDYYDYYDEQVRDSENTDSAIDDLFSKQE